MTLSKHQHLRNFLPNPDVNWFVRSLRLTLIQHTFRWLQLTSVSLVCHIFLHHRRQYMRQNFPMKIQSYFFSFARLKWKYLVVTTNWNAWILWLTVATTTENEFFAYWTRCWIKWKLCLLSIKRFFTLAILGTQQSWYVRRRQYFGLLKHQTLTLLFSICISTRISNVVYHISCSFSHCFTLQLSHLFHSLLCSDVFQFSLSPIFDRFHGKKEEKWGKIKEHMRWFPHFGGEYFPFSIENR